jgi:N-carbamoyl-L-amino-acid hydrolase
LALWEALIADASAVCAERGVTLEVADIEDALPAAPPPWLLALTRSVCESLDPHTIVLPSGAGHDTAHLAAIGPAALIFVPSVGGRSHCPEEHTDSAQLVLGAQALLQAVLAVDVER